MINEVSPVFALALTPQAVDRSYPSAGQIRTDSHPGNVAADHLRKKLLESFVIALLEEILSWWLPLPLIPTFAVDGADDQGRTMNAARSET